MRPFHLEYRAIAGYHDGVGARVIDTDAPSPLVSLHEAMHGRIFRETPDGQVHASYCLAAERRALPDAVLAAVRTSSKTCFEVSRLPHESFATYLSIKSLPASEESTYLRQLTPEYLQYFRPLSDRIDAFFPSSYLQFLIAWNLAVLVFSSPLLERFQTLDVSIPIDLSPDENPAHRLTLLLREFERSDMSQLSGGLERVARDTCKQRGMRYWNIFSEDAWTEALYSGGVVSKTPALLEFRMSDFLREQFVPMVPFTVLHGRRLIAAQATFGRSLDTKLNLRPRVPGFQESDEQRLQDEVVKTAAAESQSLLVNREYYSPPCIDALQEQTEDLLHRCAGISIYSACPPGRNLTHWLIVGWAKRADDSPHLPEWLAESVAEYPSSAVLLFLKRWLVRRARGVVVPELRAIILAIRGPDEGAQLLDRLQPILEEDLYSRICWYCWEGFMDMHNSLVDSGTTLFFGDLPETAFREYQDRSLIEQWSYNGLVLKALLIGQYAHNGVIMKALPMQSAAPLGAFQDMLVEAGKLQPASQAAIARLVPLASELVQVARRFWREY